jgi:hypothetical protein
VGRENTPVTSYRHIKTIMKRNSHINTRYLVKKFIIYPPFLFWVWLGKKMNWFDRYHHFQQLKNTLLETDMFNDEMKKNSNPFRIKKVGDKYEYDFVSYDEWEKIIEDDEGIRY